MSEPGAPTGRTGSQAVERALAVLSLFSEVDPAGMSLTEVSAAADLRPSTAHRLLRALVRSGYLRQDVDSERYRLGAMAAVLGRAADAALGLDLGQPLVESLARSSGESSSLGVRDGGDVLIVLASESPQPLRFEREAGARVPLHASAIGKALLAFDGRDAAGAVRALGGLERFTERTISDAGALMSELTAIRSSGVSVNLEERYVGVAAIAAPVLDPRGVARAAVGVQLPSARLDAEREAELAGLVLAAATELGELLASAG